MIKAKSHDLKEEQPIAENPLLEVYTDGSVVGNPGAGGAGVFIYNPQTREPLARAYGVGHCTINRAEMLAVLLALRLTPKGSRVELYTDSSNALGHLRKIRDYPAQGWRHRTPKGEMKRLWNSDLLRQILPLVQEREIRFLKVRGHSDCYGNQYADRLARDGAEWANRELFASCSLTEPYLAPTNVDIPLVASFVPDRPTTSPFAPVEPATDGEIERQAWHTSNGRRYGRRSITGGYRLTTSMLDRGRARMSRNIATRRGNHIDFLHRFWREAERASQAVREGRTTEEARMFFDQLFEHITDFRMLRVGWEQSESGGSLAAGVDGRTFESYNEQKKFQELRQLQQELRHNMYKPQRLRRVWIPKPGDRGMRPIDIPTVRDRAVETALNLALPPILDPLMHRQSVGFRPGQSVKTGLAILRWYVLNRGLTTVATMDLRSAFSRVPKGRMTDVVNEVVPNRKLQRLLGKIIGRPLPQTDGMSPKWGLAQGAPLSPTLLNLYLTKHLDEPWARDHPDLPIIRYADDLALLLSESGQAPSAIAELRRRLEAHGLLFRDDPTIVDLKAGQEIQTWGYRLWLVQGRLQIGLPPHPVHEWTRHLGTPADPVRLLPTIRGYLEHAGPALEPDPAVHTPSGLYPDWYQRVDELLAEMGRAELVRDLALPRDELQRMWSGSWSRWHCHMLRVSRQLDDLHAPPPRAPQRSTLLGDWIEQIRGIATVEPTAA